MRHGSAVAANLLLAVSFAGCALAPDDFTYAFVDPTKYDFMSCPALVQHQKILTKREQDLRELMDKADQGTGGVVVGALAYRTDYINARGELKLVQEVAQRKECAREIKPSQ
jgi:hypothetical protein